MNHGILLIGVLREGPILSLLVSGLSFLGAACFAVSETFLAASLAFAGAFFAVSLALLVDFLAADFAFVALSLAVSLTVLPALAFSA